MEKVALIVLVSLLPRFLVGIHSYSGEGKPPMFGDFEAQRHWMEITLHTPISEWYHNTTKNDLLYWGLDYPVLTAYWSYAIGLVGDYINPSMFALTASRGYESLQCKAFMRGSVVFGDLLFYIPACWVFINTYYKPKGESLNRRIFAFLFLVLQPALLLVDHGHFQYNGVSLGLVVLSISFIFKERHLLGSVFFVLSICYKQMNLYYAPAFFFYLLGRNWRKKDLIGSVWRIGKIGFVVVATFLICFAPFLVSQEQILQVIHRVFPVARGLYEDKVANFWCSTSPIFRWKDFPVGSLLKFSTIITMLSFLPSGFLLMFRPTEKSFLFGLLNCSFSFFLFSFHVHEKTILLPLLPATLMVLDSSISVLWFTSVSVFSMFPLLEKDGVTIPYLVCMASLLWILLYLIKNKQDLSKIYTLGIGFTVLGILDIHTLSLLKNPPHRYPDLWLLLFAVFSFVHFVVIFLYGNYYQWKIGLTELELKSSKPTISKKKK